MRDILFRGKTYSDKWVFGYLIKGNIDNDFYIKENLSEDAYWIDGRTVGQFTGLTDKNGKKIFEGDIVVKNEWYREMTFIVKYDQSRGGYFPFASGDGCGCCETETITPDKNGQVNVEVIGNIYDNHELLGE